LRSALDSLSLKNQWERIVIVVVKLDERSIAGHAFDTVLFRVGGAKQVEPRHVPDAGRHCLPLGGGVRCGRSRMTKATSAAVVAGVLGGVVVSRRECLLPR
jgi:hypothetical protein